LLHYENIPLLSNTNFRGDYQTTDALGAISQFEYDEAGQRTAEIDALGRRTEYAYDSRGNQVLIRYPDGNTETSQYDPEGNLLAETDRAGHTTKRVYDAAGRNTRVTDALGKEMTWRSAHAHGRCSRPSHRVRTQGDCYCDSQFSTASPSTR